LNHNLQKSQISEDFSLLILSSITLFLISFFFIFWIGSYFEADIFPLENRATIQTTFHNYIFDKYADAVVITLLTILWLCLSIRGMKRIVSATSYGMLTATAFFTNFGPLLDVTVLVSIPIIAAFFVYHHFSSKRIIQFQTRLLLSFFSFAVLFIAATGMIITLLSFSSSVIGTIRNHAVEIFLLFSSFSSALILLLIVGTLIKLLTIKRVKKLKINIKQYQFSPQKIKRKSKFLFLSLFILLSIFFALLPHQSFINNENELVGADSVSYVNWLNSLMVDDQGELMYQAFVVQHSGDMPLSLLLFSVVLTIFPDNPYQAIDHLPLILSPILVLAVFFLTRELTSNDTVSLLASFLTAISFQPLVGIYSGLYANWLALIFGYLSFIFLLRFLKKPKGINYIFFSILLFALMLSHVYTWTLFALFIGIFLLVSCCLKMFERRRVVLVFLVIAAFIAFDAGKSLMTDASVGLERNVSIMSKSESFGNLDMIWSNLFETSHVYAGGQFGNFLILSLCIFWLFRSNLRVMPNLFIAIFLSIAILPIVFGDELIQPRVFLNIPFQIPAAIGLAFLANQQRGTILVFAISIWILTMSIQAITNFI